MSQFTTTRLTFGNPMLSLPEITPATEVITQFYNAIQTGDYQLVLNFPYGASVASLTVQSAYVTTAGAITLKVGGVSVISDQPVDTDKHVYFPSVPHAIAIGEDIIFTMTTDVDGIIGLSVSLAITRGS